MKNGQVKVGSCYGHHAHWTSNQWTFVGAYLKCLVYATSGQDVELQQHMENACETIRGKAGIL
jgi:hypothetical protein